MVSDFTRHVPFFARIDALLDQGGGISAQQISEHVSVREMRAHLLVMKYLEADHGISISSAQKRDAAERERIDEIVRAAQGKPASALLKGFVDELKRRNLSLLTVRQYVSTASRFFNRIDVSLHSWGAREIRAVLKRAPGQRNNLGALTSYCRSVLKWDVPDLSATAVPSGSKEPVSVTRFARAIEKIDARGTGATEAEYRRVLELAFGFRAGGLNAATFKTKGREIYLLVDSEEIRIPRSIRHIAVRIGEFKSPSVTSIEIVESSTSSG